MLNWNEALVNMYLAPLTSRVLSVLCCTLQIHSLPFSTVLYV